MTAVGDTEIEAYCAFVLAGSPPRPARARDARPSLPAPMASWSLIQAAVSILRRDPPQTEGLRAWALRIAAGRGKQVAVVALARRLAGILDALREMAAYCARRLIGRGATTASLCHSEVSVRPPSGRTGSAGLSQRRRQATDRRRPRWSR